MTLALSFQQAAWFLPFVLPICIYVAWSDLSAMRIPNVSVIALLGVYLVIGLMVLPFDAYYMRLLNLIVVLLAGFILSSLGLMGAGDAKFAAAMAPFIAGGDAVAFLLIFCAVLIVSWALHRGLGKIPAVRRATPDWASWQERKLFPMGVALAGALVLYLAQGLGGA